MWICTDLCSKTSSGDELKIGLPVLKTPPGTQKPANAFSIDRESFDHGGIYKRYTETCGINHYVCQVRVEKSIANLVL